MHNNFPSWSPFHHLCNINEVNRQLRATAHQFFWHNEIEDFHLADFKSVSVRNAAWCNFTIKDEFLAFHLLTGLTRAGRHSRYQWMKYLRPREENYLHQVYHKTMAALWQDLGSSACLLIQNSSVMMLIICSWGLGKLSCKIF